MMRWSRMLVVGVVRGSSVLAGAADKHMDAPQLTTYVKPEAPASGTEAHSVMLLGMLGADGRLHELAAIDAGDQLAPTAAAAQWVYVPAKRGGAAVAMLVCLTVVVGDGEHVATPKEPVLLSTRLAGMLTVRREAASLLQPGGRGMVPVATMISRDGTATKAQGMSGPMMARSATERAVLQSTYRYFCMTGCRLRWGLRSR